MIHFERHTLSNGLQVIVHHDPAHQMVVTNLLYKVGSANEQPHRTGLAHLFEHLMFTGTHSIPQYDDIINGFGGTNNAFTSTDITNYYNILPFFAWKEGLKLEADRMQNLALQSSAINIQKKVVIEEFKERYLNVPYGNTWHFIRSHVYQDTHGYNWPTIGKSTQEIADTTEAELRDFYAQYYVPNNAVLCVGGKIPAEEVFAEAEAIFGHIPAGADIQQISHEHVFQSFPQDHTLHENVPFDSLNMVYPMGDRFSQDYIVYDIITEMLSNGKAAPFYQELVKKKEVAVGVSNFISGSLYPGMFVVSGRCKAKISTHELEKYIQEVCHDFVEKGITEEALNRAKSKVESALTFQEVDLQNRVFNLAYGDAQKNIEFFEAEMKHYQNLSVQEVRNVASSLFKEASYGAFRIVKK